MTVENALLLMFLFQVKHYVADYLLQFPYMYENKGKETGWIGPLANHAEVHALFTMLIMLPFVSGFALALALFDFVTHFAIDRWKATRKGGPDTTRFWYFLGADQMLHHVVSVMIIYAAYIYLKV